MLLNVFGRRFDAHVRQPGALKVESAKLLAIYLEWALFPVAFGSLPRLSGLFTPAIRVVKDFASRRLLPPFRLSGDPTTVHQGISNTRICFQGVARAHTMRIMPSFRSHLDFCQ